MPIITISRILREKLSEEGADDLVELLNQTEENLKEVIVKFSEEKYERRLVEVSSELRVFFEEKIVAVKSDLEEKIAAVKSDLEEKIAVVKSDLEEKIVAVKSDLEEKIAAVKSDIEVKITGVRSELIAKIAEARAEIIKWMFIFWAGQISVLIAILLIFFKR